MLDRTLISCILWRRFFTAASNVTVRHNLTRLGKVPPGCTPLVRQRKMLFSQKNTFLTVTRVLPRPTLGVNPQGDHHLSSTEFTVTRLANCPVGGHPFAELPTVHLKSAHTQTTFLAHVEQFGVGALHGVEINFPFPTQNTYQRLCFALSGPVLQLLAKLCKHWSSSFLCFYHPFSLLDV